MNMQHSDQWHSHVAYQHDRMRTEVARDRLAEQARRRRVVATDRPRAWFAGLAVSLGLVAAPEPCR